MMPPRHGDRASPPCPTPPSEKPPVLSDRVEAQGLSARAAARLGTDDSARYELLASPCSGPCSTRWQTRRANQDTRAARHARGDAGVCFYVDCSVRSRTGCPVGGSARFQHTTGSRYIAMGRLPCPATLPTAALSRRWPSSGKTTLECETHGVSQRARVSGPASIRLIGK